MHPSRVQRVRRRSGIVESPHSSPERMRELDGSIDCELPARLIPFLFQSRQGLAPWTRWVPPSPLAIGPRGEPLRSPRSPQTLMRDRLLRVTQYSRSEVAVAPASDRQYRTSRNTNV